jgi:CDP-6-deoxy-D-xylo-4-hexulose-3-dehydrase
MLIPNLIGNVPDWDAIKAIAEAHDLPVIEDSCDVLDSWLRGTRTGERVPITVTSFARSHAMTCAGMGGMIAVNDDDWYDRTLVRRRWGRRSESFLYGTRKNDPNRFGTLADGTPYDFIFVFDDTGYNFEPSELMAAYGLVQMDKLSEFNRRRRHNFEQLDAVFAEHEDVVIRPRTTDGADTIWMRYAFMLRDGIERTPVQEFLAERNVSTRMVWTGNILRQPGFAGIVHRQPADGLPCTDLVMDRALTLPIHHGLTSDDVGYMVECLDDLFRSL